MRICGGANMGYDVVKGERFIEWRIVVVYVQVRIWNMKPLTEKDTESDTKLLATLRDHFGSVNCVRWAKCGRLIASGSDDQVVLVHEKRPGSGTTEFGSGEPPDVENWKVLLTLRGHTADVVHFSVPFSPSIAPMPVVLYT